MTSSTLAMLEKISKTTGPYEKLVSIFPPRPLTHPDVLEKTYAVIERLMSIKSPSAAQEDLLDVLATLVDAYESHAFPIESPTMADLLAHLIEARGVSKAEVARQTKVSPATISDVLSGRRLLSKPSIVKMAKYFGVSPAVFLEAKA